MKVTYTGLQCTIESYSPLYNLLGMVYRSATRFLLDVDNPFLKYDGMSYDTFRDRLMTLPQPDFSRIEYASDTLNPLRRLSIAQDEVEFDVSF
jgi:hypothetical protein